MAIKFEDFTHLYQVSKTLRFEAKPIGETLSNFKKKNLLDADRHRANSYVKIKKLIDEYHKDFIDRALAGGCLKDDVLNKYYDCCLKKNKDVVKKFSALQKKLREQVANKLTKAPEYERLFKKDLIERDDYLVHFIDNASEKQLGALSKEEAKELLKEFHGFTTYFVGFQENRKNMYTSEEKSTGIAYRLINENLPKFVDNMETFKRIEAVPELRENLKQLFADFRNQLEVESIRDMFELCYYNKLLIQKHIDIYNAVIGGKTIDGQTEKVKGINEYVNLYNQTHKDSKLPKLQALFKQILSDRNVISWLPESFHNDREVLEALKDCYACLSENILGNRTLKSLLTSLSDFNTGGIYIRNDDVLTELSKEAFGSWSIVQNAIMLYMRSKELPIKKRESEKKYEERINNTYKKNKSFSVGYIDSALREYFAEAGEEGKFSTIEDYFLKEGDDVFDQIGESYSAISNLLDSEYPSEKKLIQDKENVAKIKSFLDSLKKLQHFVKPLLGTGNENDKDERFYGDLSSLWEELSTVTPLYNMVRNYLTSRPYSQNKIKLNFENPQLLYGWDENKERDCSSILLRRDNKYYLAFVDKDSKKYLGKEMPFDDVEYYEKMVYKQFDITKQLPKCTTETNPVKKNIVEKGDKSVDLCDKTKWKHPLTVTRELWELNNLVWDDEKKGFMLRREKDTRPKKFQKKYLEQTQDISGYNKAKETWVEFTKKFLSSYKSTAIYEIKFKKSYQSLDELYNQLNGELYKISFDKKVSVRHIDTLVKEGKMYLYQIYNKDFSEFSKGTPNMHTLYWKALFDDRNLRDVVYKLNGQAEMFFRKKSLNYNRPTHPANKPIPKKANRNDNDGNKESLFAYDLVKDRRYTMDKFMFHVPITMNFKSIGLNDINLKTREYIRDADTDELHIIGIDRGERNLLYLVMIDLHGNIKVQYSLNEIVNEYSGKPYKTDYHYLLDVREHERQEARRSWQIIEHIKELKEGYLSLVIHKISQLMLEYHAIVVLEDLNRNGFIRSRQKIEKQVYQKLEKMLIDKLNYLVDKKMDWDENGGLFNAYQLANKFESFQSLGKQKQSGFLFYIPAWNTSRIDPVTGFVNLMDTQYQSIEKSKYFFGQFDDIRYNADKGWFEFELDYDKFTTKAEGTRTNWTLCTNGSRIETFRNETRNSQWDKREVNLTEEFKQLFSRANIDLDSDLKNAIVNQENKDFFVGLLRLLRLTLQIRNSDMVNEKDEIEKRDKKDYISSPVADDNGVCFDSRLAGENLPENADANGAFNIARKGLMLVNQIKASDNLEKIEFDVSNKSWLNFAQQKPYEDE